MPARAALYFAKIETTQIGAVAALSAMGFAVIDVNVSFTARPAQVAAGDEPGVTVGPALASQRQDVLEIAGTCFKYSRLHLDPAIPSELAHRARREWVGSYFDGRRGDRLFVASLAGRPAGFLAALTLARDGGTAAVIDLIGVATDRQRAGVGRALVKAFAVHYAAAAELSVGTQAANIPSIRMYEGLGFRTAASAFVLHRHMLAGGTA